METFPQFIALYTNVISGSIMCKFVFVHNVSCHEQSTYKGSLNNANYNTRRCLVKLNCEM